jgi:hypothetical protein
MPLARGTKNRQTVEEETAKKIAAARAELVKNAPPLDFSMPLDTLDMMVHAIRHFYFRAKIAERLGDRVDRRRANAAFMQAVRAAEKVARYRHAQLSAIKLAGDINAQGDGQRLARRIDREAQGRVDEARAADRPGGYSGAAGVENRGRLVQIHATRQPFRDLSRPGCPLRPVLRLRRPLARFRSEDLLRVTGRRP